MIHHWPWMFRLKVPKASSDVARSSQLNLPGISWAFLLQQDGVLGCVLQVCRVIIRQVSPDHADLQGKETCRYGYSHCHTNDGIFEIYLSLSRLARCQHLSSSNAQGEESFWGHSSGCAPGDAGIVSAEVFFHVCDITTGHWQLLERCIVGLLP